MVKHILSLIVAGFPLFAGEYIGFGIRMGKYQIEELNSTLASKGLSIPENPLEYGGRYYYENGLIFGLSGFRWKSTVKSESLSIKAVGKSAMVEGGYSIPIFKRIKTRVFLGAGSRDISLKFIPLLSDVSLDSLLDNPSRTSELYIANFTFSIAGEVIFPLFHHLYMDIKGGYFYSPYKISRWKLKDGARLMNPPKIDLSSPFISLGFVTDIVIDWAIPLPILLFLIE